MSGEDGGGGAPRGLLARWFGPLRPGSLRSGLLVLTTTALGAGVLTLPFAVMELGWGLGSAVILALALLNVASLELLLDAGMREGAASYSELICKVQGRKTAGFLDLTVSVITWGAITAYFIFIKQLLPPLLVVVFGLPQALAEPGLVLPAVAAVVFGIALPQDITAIGKFSLLGVCSVIYASGLLICSAASEGPGLLALPAVVEVGAAVAGGASPAGLANACALVISGFLCQYNIFFIYADVREPTVRRLRKITRVSTLFQAICYLTLGLCGYSTFGAATHDNIYTNFPASDVRVNVGRLLVCSSLCISIPLCIFAARANFVGLVSRLLPGSGEEGPMAYASLSRAYAFSQSALLEEDGVHMENAIFSPPPWPSQNSALPSHGGHAPLLGIDTGCMAEAPPSPLAAPEALGAAGWLLHVGATAVILLSTLALAFAVPSVSFLLGKLGGVCGVTQMYLMPGLVLLRRPHLRRPAERAAILLGFAAASAVGLCTVVL